MWADLQSRNWRLGEALRKLARKQGARTDKNFVASAMTFQGTLRAVGLDARRGVDAQRIACTPLAKLTA